MRRLLWLSSLTLAAVLIVPAAAAPISGALVNSPGSQLSREVGHELLMLPWYTVFDNLEFRIDGSTVILTGQVTRPSLKDDAERVVKRIEGVERVQNDIHVLPASPVDDQVRLAAFRAIYGTPALSRYGQQAIPPIHILVESGQITLDGVVASEADRNLAYMKALDVPGVFSVSNHLKIERLN